MRGGTEGSFWLSTATAQVARVEAPCTHSPGPSENKQGSFVCLSPGKTHLRFQVKLPKIMDFVLNTLVLVLNALWMSPDLISLRVLKEGGE